MCNPHLHPRKSNALGFSSTIYALKALNYLCKRHVVQTNSENTQIESNWKYKHIQLYK